MNGRLPETVAIMQPYLFPYLGYFQLARAVDEFWLLDTVNFIHRGWMNRNNLLVGETKKLFTIPVSSGPRDQLICEKTFAPQAAGELDKLDRTMRNAYAKALHLGRALGLVARVREAFASSHQRADFTGVAEFALRETFDMIGVDTPIRRISTLRLADKLKGQERIIAACKAIGAGGYVNMIGGRKLYDHQAFLRSGLSLWFLEPVLLAYGQGRTEFTPGLSVLDAMAHVSPGNFPELLDAARLIPAGELADIRPHPPGPPFARG